MFAVYLMGLALAMTATVPYLPGQIAPFYAIAAILVCTTAGTLAAISYCSPQELHS